MMLAVRPDLVRKELAEDCHLGTSPALGAAYVPTNMQGRTRRGVVGYPTHATEEQGRRMLADVIDRVAAAARTLAEEGTPWSDAAGHVP
jgi:creatinine amidohydrolase/Fe(II)-dependent formamide hydrolase-like protein